MDLDRTDPGPPPRYRRGRQFREGNLALTALVILPIGFAVACAILVGGLLGILHLFGLFP